MIQSMTDKDISDQALPVLFHLANTLGIAQFVCCSVVPLVYPRLELANQLIVRGILDRHLKDSNVQLRCVALQAIAHVGSSGPCSRPLLNRMACHGSGPILIPSYRSYLMAYLACLLTHCIGTDLPTPRPWTVV